jgi:hypothetical protein
MLEKMSEDYSAMPIGEKRNLCMLNAQTAGMV